MAILGCGFWSGFQTAAWREFSDRVDLVACCDPDISKAHTLAQKFNIQHAYQDAEVLFTNHRLDVVDIISDVDSHSRLSFLAANQGVSIICQKPMSGDLPSAQRMIRHAEGRGVSFYVHENFRWQTPIRALKRKLDLGIIGKPFKAHIKFCSSFPVFENQPFLAELDQFILTDVGTHILDVARFLFGEASMLTCQTHQINPNIKGEDVANVFMVMGRGVHCYAEMSYASILEHERFPQTFILVEGDGGSLSLGPGYEIRTTTKEGTTTEYISLQSFDWADPDYALIHASIYSCNKNLLSGLEGKGAVETTGSDNLKTLQLVFDAYQCSNTGRMKHYS